MAQRICAMKPSQKTIKIFLLLAICLAISSFFLLDLEQVFNLESIKERYQEWQSYYVQHQWLVVVAFLTIYTFSTALSLPIAALLTLLSGAIFGFGLGLFIASFASSLGALIAFLGTRYLFKDAIQKRYSNMLSQCNQAFEKEGLWYLFALRLVPLFPFFLVNMLMALLPMNAFHFYWVSQIGMLAGTAVYVYAGVSLSQIQQVSDILSVELWIAFSLMGLFPLVAKKFVAMLKHKL